MMRINSITNKTVGIITITFLLFIAILIPALVEYESVEIEKNLKQKLIILAGREAAEITSDFNLLLNKAETQARYFENMIESKQTNREAASDLIKKTVTISDILYGSSVIFDRNGLDGKDAQYENTYEYGKTGRFICWWYGDKSKLSLGTLPNFEEDDFYMLVKDHKDLMLLEPYYYPLIDGTELFFISAASPIRFDNKHVGESFCDMNIDRLNTTISNISIFESDYAALFSPAGMYVVHPDPEKIGRKIKFDRFEKLNSNSFEKGEIVFDIHTSDYLNEEVIDLFYPIKIDGIKKAWYLRISLPTRIVSDRIVSYRNKLIGIIAVAALFIIIIVYLILYFTIRPVTIISENLINLAVSGSLGAKPYHIKSNDEIGILSRSYNILIQSIIEAEKLTEKIVEARYISDTALEMSKSASWFVNAKDYPDRFFPSKGLLQLLGMQLPEGINYISFNTDWQKNKDFLNKECIEGFENTLSNALAGKDDSPNSTYQMCCASDNKKLWLHTTGRVTKDEKGNVVSIKGVTQDITEQIEQEEELRKNEARLKQVVEAGKLGTFEIDLETANTNIDSLMYEVVGVSQDSDNVLVDFFANVHPDYLDKIFAKLEVIKGDKTKTKIETEFRYNHPIKGEIWITEQAKVVDRNANGTGGKLIGYLRDSTEKKQQEKHIESISNILNIAQRVAGVGHFEWFPKNDLLTGSSEYFKIFETTQEQHACLNDFLSVLHPDDVQKTNKAISDATTHLSPFDATFRIQVKSGVKYIHTLGVFDFDKEGKPIHFLATTQDITERKNVEREIIEAKNNLDLALKSANMGTWKYDFKKNTIAMDENAMQFYDLDALVITNFSKHWETKIDDEDLELVNAIMTEVMSKQEENYQCTFRINKSNGEIAYLMSIGRIVYDRNEQPIISSGLLWDITEIKKAENIIKASQKDLKSVIESVPVGLAIIRIETSELVLVNKAALDIFNVDEDDVSEFSATDVYTNPNDRVEVLEQLERDGLILNKELEFNRFGSDETYWALFSIIPIQYNNEQMGLVCMQDLTEIKELQLKLEDAYLAADSIVETITIPTAVTNLETGKILRINNAMADFHKVDARAFDGMNVSEWYLNPEERLLLTKKLKEGGSVKDVPIDFVRYSTKEQRNVLLSLSKINYLNEEAVVGSVMDITELTKTQMDLIRVKEAAEAANIAKSTFLANMSHEIRTPMNAIIGFSEILNRKVKDPIQREYLSSIQSSGKALLGLINDILDLSKIEAGKMEIVYDFIDIRMLMSELNTLFSHKSKEKGLSFETIVREDFPYSIEIDELKIRQVAINLVSNAIKFTKQGFVQVAVSSKIETDETLTLILTVEDSGIGIAENKLDAVFSYFTQEDNSITRNFGGTGLGLSISKNIVKLFNGTISIKSKTSEGSTFTIELPGIKFSKEVCINKKVSKLNPDEIKFAKAKVLVVDDIESNQNLLKAYLESYDFNISFANNGKEAVEKAQQLLPDLIFMDIRMPIMDGYIATEKILANPITKGIPVIACTASAFVDTEKEILQLDFNGYIRKPILLQDLLTQLCSNLEWEQIEVPVDAEIVMEHEIDMKVVTQLKSMVTEWMDKFETQRSSKVKLEFAELLISEGEKLNSDWLVQKGNQLQLAINSFNIENTNKLMNELKIVFS